jgi:hypothetical protein
MGAGTDSLLTGGSDLAARPVKTKKKKKQATANKTHAYGCQQNTT